MLPGNWDGFIIASSTKFVPGLLAVKAEEDMWQVIGFSVCFPGSLYIRVSLSFCPLPVSHAQRVQERTWESFGRLDSARKGRLVVAGWGKSELSSFPTGAVRICLEPVIKLHGKNSSSCYAWPLLVGLNGCLFRLSRTWSALTGMAPAVLCKGTRLTCP